MYSYFHIETIAEVVQLNHDIAPTWVEFLFRVLLGIGALFRVVTPHSSVPLRITSRLVFSRFFDLRGNLGIVKEKSFLLSDYTSLYNAQKLWRWEAKT